MYSDQHVDAVAMRFTSPPYVKHHKNPIVNDEKEARYQVKLQIDEDKSGQNPVATDSHKLKGCYGWLY